MITTTKVSIEDMYLDVTGMDMRPVAVLGDYRENGASGVIDAGCLSAEELKAYVGVAIPHVNAAADAWTNSALSEAPLTASPACTCCIKEMEDGTVIMGRNMDLPLSFSPAVIFRTKGDGKDTYDTVNISYSAPGPISFDQVAELGAIPTSIFATYVVACCDALNSEGLYLQYNMRECVDCVNTSTNPDDGPRVASFNTLRLVADHCATIDEALAYLRGLDIYDPKTPAFDWSMAIGMMDKTGRYGVAEFVDNQVIWNEGTTGFACGQANFYWSREAAGVRNGSGLGRWRKLMERYYDIETQEDMESAMGEIRYSGFITNGDISRDWKVDWITEVNDKIPYFMQNRLDMMYEWRDEYGIEIDEKHLAKVLDLVEKEKRDGGPIWGFEYLRNPANYYGVMTFMDLFIKCFAKLPIEAQKMTGYMECTTIGYTANNKELGYTNRFFEMDDIYHIGLHETTIDRVPTEKKFGNA